MKMIFVVLSVIFINIPSLDAWEIINKDAYLYFGTTDKPLKVAWNPEPNADEFAFNLYHYESQAEVARGRTPNNTVVFMLPYAGHYHARVCSIDNAGDPIDEALCTLSIDSTRATVDGQPQAWWVYGNIAPPGPITFD